MKKSLLAVLVAAVLVASFGVVGSVYAQGGNPGSGYGVATQQQLQTEDGLGLYHDEIMAAFAEALDMTVEEIEAKIAEGFTIVEIAQAAGCVARAGADMARGPLHPTAASPPASGGGAARRSLAAEF